MNHQISVINLVPPTDEIVVDNLQNEWPLKTVHLKQHYQMRTTLRNKPGVVENGLKLLYSSVCWSSGIRFRWIHISWVLYAPCSFWLAGCLSVCTASIYQSLAKFPSSCSVVTQLSNACCTSCIPSVQQQVIWKHWCCLEIISQIKVSKKWSKEQLLWS